MLNFFNFFFKKRKIQGWEVTTIRRALQLLGIAYTKYIDQVSLNSVCSVKFDTNDIPNYAYFTRDSDFFHKFEIRKQPHFVLSGIKVEDLFSEQSVSISLYFGSGIIHGYSIDEPIAKKYEFVANSVDVSEARKKVYGEEESKPILALLSKKERNEVNLSQIYPSEVDGKDYYHLLELEDGDFVGITLENQIYHVTHDPFGAKLLPRSLLLTFLLGDLSGIYEE